MRAIKSAIHLAVVSRHFRGHQNDKPYAQSCSGMIREALRRLLTFIYTKTSGNQASGKQHTIAFHLHTRTHPQCNYAAISEREKKNRQQEEHDFTFAQTGNPSRHFVKSQ